MKYVYLGLMLTLLASCGQAATPSSSTGTTAEAQAQTGAESGGFFSKLMSDDDDTSTGAS